MDFNDICRFCMGNFSLNPIFPVKKDHKQFTTAIFLITGLSVKLNDGLPQKICAECLKQINNTMKFRAQCRNTQEELLNVTKQSKSIQRTVIPTQNFRLEYNQVNKILNIVDSDKGNNEKLEINENIQSINNDTFVNDEKSQQYFLKQNNNDTLKKPVAALNIESNKRALVNNEENFFNDKQSVQYILNNDRVSSIKTDKIKETDMNISSDVVLEEEMNIDHFNISKINQPNMGIEGNDDSVSKTIKIVKAKNYKASDDKNKAQNYTETDVKNKTKNMSQELFNAIDIPSINYSVSITSKIIKTKKNESLVVNNKVQNNTTENKNHSENPSVQKHLNVIDGPDTGDFVSRTSEIVKTNNEIVLDKNKTEKPSVQELLSAIDTAINNDLVSRTSQILNTNKDIVLDKNKTKKLSMQELLNVINIPTNNDSVKKISLIVKTKKNEALVVKNKDQNNIATDAKNYTDDVTDQEPLNKIDILDTDDSVSRTNEIVKTDKKIVLDKKKTKDLPMQEFLNESDIISDNDSVSKESNIVKTNNNKVLDYIRTENPSVQELNEIDIPDTDDYVSRKNEIVNTNDNKYLDNKESDNFSVKELINSDDDTEVHIDSFFNIDFNDKEGRRVVCQLCHKSVLRKSRYTHMFNCHPSAYPRRDKCKLCNTVMSCMRMEQHYMDWHADAPLQCRYCKHVFKDEEDLVSHAVACKCKHKQKSNRVVGFQPRSSRVMTECDICHEKLQKASLKRHHDVKHDGIRPFCEHCGKGFSTTYRLEEHYRAKHGYEKFKCSICPFQTSSARSIESHERKHSGEKPFVCDTCGAKFHASYLLSQHTKSHRTERLYKCDTCSASFKTSNALSGHTRFVHRGARRVKKRPLDNDPKPVMDQS